MILARHRQLRIPLTILLGLAFALMPTVGPFMAVLLLIGQPFSVRRTDTIWGLAAIFIGLPLWINYGVVGLASGGGPVIAAWLVYRAFSQLPAIPGDRRHRFLSIGLLVGLLLTVVIGWIQNANLSLAYRTAAQAISWETNPALYGHAVLVLGCAISLLVPFVRLRIASLALAALGILASGSREAGLAWLVFALILPSADKSMRTDNRKHRYYSLVAVLLVIFAVLGSLLGWGRMGFLVDVVPLPTSEKNLVRNSEFPESDMWRSYGVAVGHDGLELNLPDGTLTVFEVTKIDSDPWVRLQQIIDVEPGQTYAASAWMRSDEPVHRYGIQGWAELRNGSTLSVVGVHGPSGWATRASGPVRLLGSGTADTFDGWQRNWFSFVYEGDQSPAQLFIGLAPDNRLAAGSTAQFAGFQLERGSEPTEYVPGSAVRGISLGSGRLPFWSAAWQGFVRSPLIGNAEPFHEFFTSLGRQRARIQEPPAHAHNQFLHVLYQGGLLGFAGLLMFVLALAWPAFNRRDYASLLLLAVVLLANFFDTTLFYGGVLYPLAAALGWRATVLEDQSEREQQRLAQFLNSSALALASFAVPLLAAGAVTLFVAIQDVSAGLVFEMPRFFVQPGFYYACLLWPAFVWREGLFPGYGISAPQQLRRQVSAGVLAGLVFAVIASQYPVGFGLSFVQVALLTVFGTLLLPILHAATRRLLLRAGIWGEEVVILGAGQGGQRATRSLVDNRLTGLHPVALFDDDTLKQGTRVHDVPVMGPLEDSVEFARQRGINHAIIAIPTMRAELVGRFMDVTGRRFKRVQFIPDLPGMPAEDVSASNLDGMLAIEFNNGLFSVPNQTAKRLIDLVGASLGALLLLIPLAIIYLLIRLDSRGPAFYMGERVGMDGRPFKCLKFRTMFVDADERLKELMASNPLLRAEYERYHKLDDDPRVTRIGSVLRRYSLDELPQLFNVLRGEMSLVGARPYLVRELPAMGSYVEIILQAKPGITGLWQVSGRNELSFRERLKLESHYVRNWSIWWDMIILAQTVEAVITRRGAK